RSASCAPLQAAVTMARSRRRWGAKMPGVSTKMICALFCTAMPRIKVRVVCTLRETIATFAPTSALSRVDLPAFGAPISATKPQRLSPASAIQLVQGDADLRQQGRCCGLLGGAFGGAETFRRRPVWQGHGDAKFWAMVRAGARELAVVGRGQAARLRPFLQHGFRIAQRPERPEHAVLPEALHPSFRCGVAAVEVDRADQRLAGIAQNS